MDFFIKLKRIDLNATFNCGQCFRWRLSKSPESAQKAEYIGFAGSKSATVRQETDGITLLGVEPDDIPYWENYFCADEDYSALIETFSQDSTLKAACEFAPGIRLLRQEPFETLISFIISQNNNIKRITGIIDRICGISQICNSGRFPQPCEIAALTPLQLEAMGAGYRARYILDAANKINFGEISLDEIKKIPYNESKVELLKIIGVGDKVADCVLLFGFYKLEAFPHDVWIKRALERYYPDGLPECTKGYEGIAQQFLFHYIRNL